MKPEPEQHSIRRIVLPSGRTIEVVRFYDDEARRSPGLHHCGDCHCDLVQPRDWNEAGDGCWALALECPNCGWLETGTYDREQIDRLEERLEEGLAEMLTDLQRLTQANMADEITRFATALQAGVILPEDF